MTQINLFNTLPKSLLFLCLIFFSACGGEKSGGGSGNNTQVAGEENTAPEIISAPEIFASENKAYIYKVRAIDNESDLLRFSITTAPSGMEINPETGTISWVPTSSQGGGHNVTVQVTDGKDTGTQ
jgi:hypothetical protein